MRPLGPVPCLMIAAKLAQRRLVQLKQNLAQLLGFRITGCETLSVLTQHADEGVSVLVADFVVLAVAIVETGLAHAALHGAQGAASSRSGEVARRNDQIQVIAAGIARLRRT